MPTVLGSVISVYLHRAGGKNHVIRNASLHESHRRERSAAYSFRCCSVFTSDQKIIRCPAIMAKKRLSGDPESLSRKTRHGLVKTTRSSLLQHPVSQKQMSSHRKDLSS